jgi:peptidoglycan/xylan/chitin deacetylase (PgdA/CDA1 family)
MNKEPGKILIRSMAAAGVVIGILAIALTTLTPRSDDKADPPGLKIVVRTPIHLEGANAISSLVGRFAKKGVQRVWVQVKQDESDEYVAGSAFYPSGIAPVALGFDDNRLGLFIDTLAQKGIEPMAWMPVLHDRAAADAHPDWRSLSITEDGKTEVQEGWLCPNHQEAAQYQAAIASEVVSRYPALRGLYLDFIRYDDDFACVCPKCLAEVEKRCGWRERMQRPLEPQDIRRAAAASDWLWKAWINMRAEKIVTVINTIRDAIDEVRPDFHMAAFVLPFTSERYEFNTQSGQDLARMARAGLDEIVLMGYWDDWDLSPWWVNRALGTAGELLGEEAELSFVLDGDMSVRRTRLTLEALGPLAAGAGWFHYGNWSEKEFNRLRLAVEGYRKEGSMPRPDHVSVVIRVDTEPDYQPSYEAVHPAMIETLLALFAEEHVKATFITVGKLAEKQTEILHRAVREGHEIGSHAYDHEQIDSLDNDQQAAVVDKGLSTLRDLGFEVHGFGAPRNSISDVSRDRLMAWNLEYDGSEAYDPLKSFLDIHYAEHSAGAAARILVIPFIMPNDWDARALEEMSAEAMLEAWKERLDRVIEIGEPVFVLDVHQWSASQPENLAALRDFIRYVNGRSGCKIVTLREAARHARAVLDRYEPHLPTSGDSESPRTVSITRAEAGKTR